MRLLILVPAYNEAETLAAVVAEVRDGLPTADILVVDDGSTDRTAALVPTLGVRWLRLTARLGTGAAVRTGLRYARLRGFDVVIRIDGDGQHPISAVPALLAPLLEHRADVVIGSRYVAGVSGAETPRGRRAVHRTLGFVLSALTHRPVTDPTSGFWAFGPQAIALLAEHHPSGYPEPELRLFLSRNGLRALEIATPMRARPGGQTSLTANRLGTAMARLLLHLVVVPLRATVRDRP